jgi:hypothetical protein
LCGDGTGHEKSSNERAHLGILEMCMRK